MNLVWHLMVLYSCFIADTVGNGCPAGFKGTNCHQQNVALNQPAFQLDTYGQYHASLAVDGNTDTHVTNGHCSHTGKTPNAYWTVILNDTMPYNISQFTLYLRNNNADRYTNLHILVDGHLCQNIFISDVNGKPIPNPVNSQCNQTLTGNNVTVRVDNAYLTLCEVQIWVCSNGWFGDDCENACKCLGEAEVCDKESGYCSSGCAKGYHGDGCQTECPDGFFGNCLLRCNCQNSTEICNKTSGACHHSGCKIGTYEPDCQTVCSNGWFGDDCGNACKCLDATDICDKETGYCRSGCAKGYHGNGCQTECPDGFFGNCLLRCNCQNSTEICNKMSGACHYSGCKIGTYEPDCQTGITSSPVGAIVGGVVVAILALVATGLGIFFLRRWRALKKQAGHVYGDGRNDNLSKLAGGDDPAPPPVAHVNHNHCEAVDHYYNIIPANIPLDSLKQHIRSKTEEDGFETEFKMIHYGLNADHEVGKKPENKKRNRFIELFPYDHSRVTLVPDGDSTWDYINASFVTGYSDNTKFIAAQGPNPVTVDDFWRMVWQQNVRKIVMLTRLMEGNKKKCQQYWPEGDEAMQCGNITIQTTLCTVRADFTTRKFKIQHTNSPKRTVTQFHFTTWPDHGVPTTPALVGFWKQVKHADTETDEEAGPPIIHCSQSYFIQGLVNSFQNIYGGIP